MSSAQDAGQSDAACARCGGIYWTDAEDGGQCINCGMAHPNMAQPDEPPEPCPMGCGRTTEDVYGGPCNACWDAT